MKKKDLIKYHDVMRTSMMWLKDSIFWLLDQQNLKREKIRFGIYREIET